MPYAKLDDDSRPSPPESPQSEQAPDEKYGLFRSSVIKHCARTDYPLAAAYLGLGILQAIFFFTAYAVQQWISAVWLCVTAFFTQRSLTRRSRGNMKLVTIMSFLSAALAVMGIAVALGFLASYTDPDIDHGPNKIINFALFVVIIVVSLVSLITSFLPALGACCHVRRSSPLDVSRSTQPVPT